MKKLLTLILLGVAFFSVNGNQIPIAVTGFNQDLVVEAGTPVNAVSLQAAVTATMDFGTAKTGSTWYQVGENVSAPTTGLPTGTTFISGADPTTSFALQSAAGNNAVMVDAAHTSGSFNLVSPSLFTSLSLLGASANGNTTVGLTLRFSDATTLSLGNIVVKDWFQTGNVAIAANGRVNVDAAFFDSVNSGSPRLFQIDLALSGPALAKQIAGIDFSYVGAPDVTRAAIFGLSGSAVPGGSVPDSGDTLVLLLAGVGALATLHRCLPVHPPSPCLPSGK